MNTRLAIEADIRTLVRLGRFFWSLTPYRDIPYCPDSVAELCRQCIAQGLLIVAEDEEGIAGMVGAVAVPLQFNRAVLVAAELFWWVEPRARNGGTGKWLLAGLEQAAKAAGVTRLSMGAFEDIEIEKAASVYERAGYQASERTWTKGL